jgi:3-hydroxyisobutyrate dehydrogenase-like beta-hydroxyacid dehydrogenase
VLRAFCRETVHVGPTGAGAALKLAINLALAVTNETIAETLLLAERSGVPRDRAYDVLALGALASPFVRYKREAFLAPEDAPIAFSIELMRKDVGLALELAAGAGLSAPAGRAAGEVLERAIEHGHGNADIASVVRELDRA